MSRFNIEGLDHVAIRVVDIEASASWYQEVLGLTKYQLPEWGDFPIFLLAGKSGVALFPANIENEPIPKNSKNIKIDHFAFRVTRENLKRQERGIQKWTSTIRFKTIIISIPFIPKTPMDIPLN